LKEAKSKTKTKKKGQMVDAEERWNKRCLTDEFLFRGGSHGPGCKIEEGNFKDKNQKGNRRGKHRVHQSTSRNVPTP
jgi:hypothetical protein